MPKPLLERCGRGDTIGTFRRAAWRRYADGLAVFESVGRERRAGAVYMWGYVVEMTVKAAVFRAKGHTDTTPLGVSHKAVGQLTAQAGLTWSGDLHAVGRLAALLVAGRATWPTASPLPLLLASEVRQRADEVATLWHPRMRYHANVAYNYEATQVRDHATWFVERFDSL